MSDSLLPDLAASPKVARKHRPPQHDFKDGHGKVAAHRHDNGGGWVANTAYVAPSVKVTRNAQVFGYARVYDACEITGASRVFGRAKLYNTSALSQNAAVSGNAMVCDSARLTDETVVTDNARLFGVTHISNRVFIGDNAVIRDTTVRGPGCRGLLAIYNNAQIWNSRLQGFCTAHGNAHIFNATITHSVINGGYLLDATVNTHFDWQRTALFNTPRALEQFNGNRAETEVIAEISVARLVVRGTMIRSSLTVPDNGVTVPENLTLFETTLSFAYETRAASFFTDYGARLGAATIHNYDCNSVSALEQSIVNRTLPPPPQPTPNIPRGYVPPVPSPVLENLELVRQRRLMRLETGSEQ